MHRILIFGKENCGKCKATRSKVGFVLDKLGLADRVEVIYYDMDSEEGTAEGAFRDVFDIPTVILDDGEEDIRRWSAAIPDSDELMHALRAL